MTIEEKTNYFLILKEKKFKESKPDSDEDTPLSASTLRHKLKDN